MINNRLAQLRNLLKDYKVNAYIIPGTDPHQSEYLPGLWRRREWITGFDGSAGDVVVTEDSAGLWTDSRYFIQAEQQLEGSGISLMKIGIPGSPDMPMFIINQLNAGQSVGIDPRLMCHSDCIRLEKALKKHQIELLYIEENLIDHIWKNQPAAPEYPLTLWPKKYAGETVASKLSRLRAKMEVEQADALVVTALDQIAWLYNIRGKDVDYNPVVIAYALVLKNESLLFVDENKISAKDRDQLAGDLSIYPYEQFSEHLSHLDQEKLCVWVDPALTSQWIINRIKNQDSIILKKSPLTPMKAIKNITELEGFRKCHLRDGVAMVKFLCWLSTEVPKGTVTEISASDKLLEFRKEQDLFRGESFSPISAYGAHGAIIHYSATKDSNVKLQPEGIFLIDSGAQYLDGTTDITRTLALGPPSNEQKDRFTRVLKGHMALSMTRFPVGTTGIQLDTIARKSLWDIAQNYGHGTGHGLGIYLNVHEGPQAISYYRGIGVALEPGMISSNEPGFYKESEYGIRIENLIEVVVDQEAEKAGAGLLKFSVATLCPIDLSLVDRSLLSDNEIEYLNNYHQRVYESLRATLSKTEREWLKEATRSI